MIRFINPVALWGLLAVAAPIIIHLLRRQRARRIPFPSLQFIQPQRTSAVRLRSPEDPWLMLLRAGILAAAALALAQPVVITQARRESWDARVYRVLVIDQSASASALTARMAEVAMAERSAGAVVSEIHDADLPSALARGIEALNATPPGRREIVVVSDFQRDALTSADIARIPETIGLRFVAVGETPLTSSFDAIPLLARETGRMAVPQVTLDGSRTRVTTTMRDGRIEGLRLLAAPGNERTIAAVLRAVAAAGAPAPSAAQPIAIAFDGASVPALAERIEASWMVATIARLLADREVQSASRDAAGRSLISAGASGQELVIRVAAKADALLATMVTRAAVIARVGSEQWREREILRIDPGVLAGWTRAPAPADVDAWRSLAPGDARWFWLFAAALLGAEMILRRRRADVARDVEAHAA